MDKHNLDGIFNKNIKEFKSSVFDLKEKMNKLLKMCDSTDFKQNEAFETLQEGLVNLIEIKYLNGEVQKELENFKEQTLKEREKAEEKNLKFQNYLYQKENIISQINYCSNYPTEEMDKIKFSEKEKIIQYYKYKEIEMDETQFDTMDYLKYELEMRKKLDARVKNLLQENESKEAKRKEKEKYFRELPTYLKDLEFSTLKAQNYLNLNITQSYSNSILSEKLPQPLFVLYNSLLCLDKTKLDYEVKIFGREEDIFEFYNKYPIIDNINFDLIGEKIDNANDTSRSHSKCKSKSQSQKKNTDNKEEGEHTDSGEINESELNEVKRENTNIFRDDNGGNRFLTRKSRRNQKPNRNLTTTYEEQDSLNIINIPKIKKFPLFLHFEIKKILDNSSPSTNNLLRNVNDTILPIGLNFYYIPVFNIITSEVITVDKKLFAFNLTTNLLMSNLFIPPANLLSSFKLEINKAINFLCEESSTNEKFFDYVQIMANNVNYNLSHLKKICEIVKIKNEKNKSTLQDLFDKNETYFDSPLKISTDSFLFRIIDRITYLPILLDQVDFLIKYKKLLPEALDEIDKERRFNLIKEKAIIEDVTKISQNDYIKIFQENFDNDLTEENFKIISIFEKDEEGNFFKKFLKVPITFYTEEEALYLCITIQRKTAKAIAYIEIGLDYPESTPKFIFKIQTETQTTIDDKLKHLISESNELLEEMNKHSHKKLSVSDEKMYRKISRNIEQELNEYHPEYCADDVKQFLLSYQVRNAILCFDIFYDLQNDKLNPTLIQSNTSNKKKMPFKFNENKNFFESRYGSRPQI